MELATVCRIKTFEMSLRLMNNVGLTKNIHGHSYRMQVNVTGTIDEKGNVIKISVLDKILNHVLSYFDHSLCLNENDRDTIDFATEQEHKIVTVPFEPTIENLSNYFKLHILEILMDIKPYKDTITGLSVFLWETSNYFAKTDDVI